MPLLVFNSIWHKIIHIPKRHDLGGGVAYFSILYVKQRKNILFCNKCSQGWWGDRERSHCGGGGGGDSGCWSAYCCSYPGRVLLLIAFIKGSVIIDTCPLLARFCWFSLVTSGWPHPSTAMAPLHSWGLLLPGDAFGCPWLAMHVL